MEQRYGGGRARLARVLREVQSADDRQRQSLRRIVPDPGIDFSVPEADLRQWLNNSDFTPYPAIAAALLNLLEGKGLRQPVYLDVIVWNYEHAPGSASPHRVTDVDIARLRAAVVKGHNTRDGEAVVDFQKLIR